MIYIKPFIIERGVNEHNEPQLSQFILDRIRQNGLDSWLHNYNGNFPFLKSVQRQFKRKGYLTEGQWRAVYNSYSTNK